MILTLIYCQYLLSVMLFAWDTYLQSAPVELREYIVHVCRSKCACIHVSCCVFLSSVGCFMCFLCLLQHRLKNLGANNILNIHLNFNFVQYLISVVTQMCQDFDSLPWLNIFWGQILSKFVTHPIRRLRCMLFLPIVQS